MACALTTRPPARTNANDFIDPVTVPLVLPELHLYSEMAQHLQEVLA